MSSRRARGPTRPNWASGSNRAGGTDRTGGSRHTLWSNRARSSVSTNRTCRSGQTLRSDWSLCARRADGSIRTGRTRRAGSSCRTKWACRANRTNGTNGTNRACRANRPCGTKWACWTDCAWSAGRANRPRYARTCGVPAYVDVSLRGAFRSEAWRLDHVDHTRAANVASLDKRVRDNTLVNSLNRRWGFVLRQGFARQGG